MRCTLREHHLTHVSLTIPRFHLFRTRRQVNVNVHAEIHLLIQYAQKLIMCTLQNLASHLPEVRTLHDEAAGQLLLG